MRILFLTDNFPPEVNAPAIRTFEHCREWVAQGVDVTVITCTPNFPSGQVFEGYRNRAFQREMMDGIEVLRVWSYIAPNQGFARRILDYVSFAATSFLAGLIRDFDLIVATSPQFFTTFTGAALSKVRSRPWVFELRDLWPDSIVATGAMKQGRVIDALERMELALYHDADLVVAVTEAFRTNLIQRGVPGGNIAVVPNGVHVAEYRTSPRSLKESRTGPFKVGYIGTMGLAHGLEVVLEAAELMSDEAFTFVLVGDGARRAALEQETEARGLANVRFHEPVPHSQIPELLGDLDMAIVPLRRSETFKTVIPSKIFEAAAAERPIALGVEGEAMRIVERYGAGLPFEPENASCLASVLTRVASDPDLYDELQAGCRRLADAYDRGRLARDMLDHLRMVSAGGPAVTQHSSSTHSLHPSRGSAGGTGDAS